MNNDQIVVSILLAIIVVCALLRIVDACYDLRRTTLIRYLNDNFIGFTHTDSYLTLCVLSLIVKFNKTAIRKI